MSHDCITNFNNLTFNFFIIKINLLNLDVWIKANLNIYKILFVNWYYK